jgi:alkylation response protein AidB-like acyl-CoA dehydrogenase
MTTALHAANAPAAAPAPPVDAPWQPRLQALAAALATTAAERDRAGGHAAAERQLIRDSGLLALSIERHWGGLGADAPAWLRAVRRLAEADSALAHVFAFHHLQLATVRLYGTAEQQRRLIAGTLDSGAFWGNALNPLDRRTTATRIDGGWRLDGAKGYCSGSVGADWLTVSAWHADTASLLIGVLPTTTPGLAVHGDWSAFGQKQTDSGTVQFDGVRLPDADVLVAPGATPSVRGTLRAVLAQSVLIQLYLGLARGAFDAGRRFVVEQGRPWPGSGVARAADDPAIQQRYGEWSVGLRAAELLADDAAAQLQQALDAGQAVTAAQRGQAAIAAAQAKAAAHRIGLQVASDLFETTGARATSEHLGLDRYWRNLRVHTLHDPLDHKLRDLGRHALDGRLPEPSPYA